jgi:hypothetical protein
MPRQNFSHLPDTGQESGLWISMLDGQYLRDVRRSISWLKNIVGTGLGG